MVTCIHIKDAKAGDYYCGRSTSYHRCPPGVHDYSALGNPYAVKNGKGSREESIKHFHFKLTSQMEHKLGPLYEAVMKLRKEHKAGRDVRLICFCKPKACHTDVIKEFVEKE